MPWENEHTRRYVGVRSELRPPWAASSAESAWRGDESTKLNARPPVMCALSENVGRTGTMTDAGGSGTARGTRRQCVYFLTAELGASAGRRAAVAAGELNAAR